MSYLPRVLVVEDAADTRLVLEVALAGDFVVVPAASAEEALAELEKQPVHIALVDYNLPGMSGVDFLRAWRNNKVHADRPIVAVTTTAAPDQLKTFVKLGFNKALPKPIPDPIGLPKLLRKLLDPPRA